MTVNLNHFKRETECVYKDERYSVRDNGAVLRHARVGKRLRKYDNQWTFGKPNNCGYMLLVSEVVHRIVATAFHGDPPSEQHIVDHIDTNRQNNRPENLRWVTRLENILLNPITCRRVEIAYGSIENFLKDPNQPIPEKLDQNFEWMRSVTKKEAEDSHKRLLDWARSGAIPSGGALGSWLYRSNDEDSNPPEPDNPIESKTPGAVQKNWKTPSEFPFCPSDIGETSLDQYLKNLKSGEVFARNKYGESLVHSADYSENSETLLVLCNLPTGEKKWSLARISIEDQQLVHESIGTFFSLDGARKQFTLGRGLKWEGGDSIDDYS